MSHSVRPRLALVPRLLAVLALVAASASCYHTSYSSSMVQELRLAEVTPIAVLRIMSGRDAETFRKQLEKASEVVMEDELQQAYWADEHHIDTLVLRPREGKLVELVKVQETGQIRRVLKVSGERDGRPFERVQIQ